MKNDNVTAEMFRKILIDAFWDGNEILGKKLCWLAYRGWKVWINFNDYNGRLWYCNHEKSVRLRR